MKDAFDVELGQLDEGIERSHLCIATQTDDDAVGVARRSLWLEVAAALHQVKALVHEAEGAARQNSDVVPDDVAQRVLNGFRQLYPFLESAIGDSSPADEETKRQVGRRVQQELLPYLLLAEAAERSLSKPRGYAGDYWTIELIYRNQPNGWSRVGPLLDRCFHELPPAASVRNRRPLISERIRMTLKANADHVVRVTSLACGPAEEVFDAIQMLGSSPGLHVDLVDFDYEALAFVAAKRDQLRLRRVISLVCANLVEVAIGRTQLPIEKQDLVYSIGLIDYFNDQLVVKLLNAVHEILRPGGRVIVGNIHPRNPVKAFMDHVLEWKLIHRTEQDLDGLFSRSRFGRPSTTIFYEPLRINSFAECIKE